VLLGERRAPGRGGAPSLALRVGVGPWLLYTPIDRLCFILEQGGALETALQILDELLAGVGVAGELFLEGRGRGIGGLGFAVPEPGAGRGCMERSRRGAGG